MSVKRVNVKLGMPATHSTVPTGTWYKNNTIRIQHQSNPQLLSSSFLSGKPGTRSTRIAPDDDEWTCSECKAPLHETTIGEIVCMACGLVHARSIEPVTNFENGKIYDSGNWAMIVPSGWGWLPVAGAVHLRKTSLFFASNRTNNKERRAINRTLLLHEIVKHFYYPTIVEERANFLCKKALHVNSGAWLNHPRLVTACVYVAAIEQHLPVSIDRLIAFVNPGGTGFGMRSLRRALANLCGMLDINLGSLIDHVGSILGRLKIDPVVQERGVASRIEELEAPVRRAIMYLRACNHRRAATGATIYVVATQLGISMTQEDIARAAEITTPTLRKYCRLFPKKKA